MDLAPLTEYNEPDYPTQDGLRTQPELLRKLPRRWCGRPAVMGTLAGLLSLTAAAHLQAEDQTDLKLAPIFMHGGGKGAFGCVAVNPPAFLTEDEARQVIEDEAKKAGVSFSDRNHVLKNVDLPETDFYGDSKEELRKMGVPLPSKLGSREGDLHLEAWNPKTHIGYVFVSSEDLQAWEAQNAPCVSSVIAFNFPDSARRLRENLSKAHGPGTIAIFYEPLAKPAVTPRQPECQSTERDSRQPPLSDEEITARMCNNNKIMEDYRREYETALKGASSEDLRRQVRDFVAWLKGQGII